jgi:hypothetical protein
MENDNTPTTVQPKSKRHWYQFRPEILAVVLGVVLCCPINFWFFTNYIDYVVLLLLLGEVIALIFLFRLTKHRLFQYSLRTLFICVTLIAIACSWFTVKMEQAKRQREAVKAIRKTGGDLMYDYQCDASGKQLIVAEPPAPLWLRKYSETTFSLMLLKFIGQTMLD